jgi:lytic murein transglycosylase
MKKLLVSTLIVTASIVSHAQTCVGDVPFNQWLDGFKQDALKFGITPDTLNQALPRMTFDQKLADHESSGKIQKNLVDPTFYEFVDKRAPELLIKMSIKKIKEHQAIFDAVEKQYGIPAAIISSFWGLESNHGAALKNLNYNTLSAVATLSCMPRRAAIFREQLLYTLLLLQKKIVTLEQMAKGNWAGEYGGMQFMAKDYIEYGVDGDGDGRIDIIDNVADTIFSAGKYLEHKGWNRHEPWLQEVTVPQDLKWEEAGIETQLSVKEWQDRKITLKSGQFPNSNLKASLLLPMGRKGPAFLVYPNFNLFMEWNEALKYSTTAAYMATRVAGAPVMDQAGRSLKPLTTAEVKELQQILKDRGEDVGDIDGVLGAKSRPAIKSYQLKFGLPADSFPDAELLKRLKN